MLGRVSLGCIFCSKIEESQIIKETDSFFLVYDTDPIQVGHLLIISKGHFMNIAELPFSLLQELILLEQQLIKEIEKLADVLGVTAIQNNGKVMMKNTHFHVHLVPRYAEDGFWDNQKIVFHALDEIDLRNRLESTS